MTAQQDVTRPGRTTWLPDGFEAIGPPLGVGATAIVWPARRVLDGRELALKVWRRPFADAGERDRFRREIRRQAVLNEVTGHVATYTWAEEDPPEGTPWIGTLRHGSSLAQLLERTGSPLPDGPALCADLLAGLAAMHRSGLVHRDVKPGNVLASGGRAQLCDLGLVLDEFGHTADGAAGTPRYSAPELAAGARPSARTDVFSAARTIRDVLGADLPAPLERLLAAAGSPVPDDRPADAAAFAAAFRTVCAGLGHRLPAPLPGRSGATEPPRSAAAEPLSRRSRAAEPVPSRSRTAEPVARRSRAAEPAVADRPGGRGSRVVAVLALVLALAAGALAVLLPRSAPAPVTAPPSSLAPAPSVPALSAPAASAPASRAATTAAPTRSTPVARPTGSVRPAPATTRPPATGRAPVPAYPPDAGRAAPDIAADGSPVVLPARPAGQCAEVLPGARPTGETPYVVGGSTVAVLRTYAAGGRACAKLVKPPGSPYAGTSTHLALTLCGEGNTCEGDWHAYPVDAGPVVVPARDGCVSTRVSMADPAGRWVVRDHVRPAACA